MRFAQPLQSVSLDQFHDPPKPCLHVRGELFQLFPHPGVEQFNDPLHASIVLHFCNMARIKWMM